MNRTGFAEETESKNERVSRVAGGGEGRGKGKGGVCAVRGRLW